MLKLFSEYLPPNLLQGIERYNIKTLEHYVVDLQARETYWLEQYGWKATGAGLVNVSSQEEIIKTPVSTWVQDVSQE